MIPLLPRTLRQIIESGSGGSCPSSSSVGAATTAASEPAEWLDERLLETLTGEPFDAEPSPRVLLERPPLSTDLTGVAAFSRGSLPAVVVGLVATPGDCDGVLEG
eukprot:1187870-Prorocentrum_minimum.AAC.4